MQFHNSPVPANKPSRPSKPIAVEPDEPELEPSPVETVEPICEAIEPAAEAKTPEDPVELKAEQLKISVHARLCRDGRWKRLDLGRVRDEMMRDCTRGKRMSKHQAQVWTYSELDRLYPPEPSFTGQAEGADGAEAGDGSQSMASTASADGAPARDGNLTIDGTKGVTTCQPSSGVQGIGNIPPGWPPLPANASLAAEIGWVQSNRLYVVEERSSGVTIVHLDRAHEPAPSRSAIGWLETSIRSYAKFVDVASKCMGAENDEATTVRRERMAIEEIRELLDEMHRDV